MKGKCITLTDKQWGEVYYALDTKRNTPTVAKDTTWKTELTTIMLVISAKVTV